MSNINHTSGEIIRKLEIDYGPDEARKITRYYEIPGIGDWTLKRTKHFALGNYEVEVNPSGNERKLHYLHGGDGLFAIFVKNNGRDTMYYVHKDYLGSYETVTDDNGVVKDKLNFDPWGRRRNPLTWKYESSPWPHLFDRGFTGHQHLEEFNLINMNGRVYDQWLGRFLQPDPFVQAPGYSQNYNRYSYAFNNPFKYVDPSGYSYEEYGDDHTNPLGGQSHGSPYNYGPSTLNPNPINYGVPYKYNWGSQQYEDQYGQPVSSSEAMAWAGRYSVSGSQSILYSYYSITTEWKNYAGSVRQPNDFTTSYGVDIHIISTYDLLPIEGLGDESPHKGPEFYYKALDGIVFNDGSVLSRDKFHLTFNFNYTANAEYLGYINGKYHINFSIGDFEITQANIRVLSIHEAFGHGVMGYGDDTFNHHKAFFAEIDSQYWNETTSLYKTHTVNYMYQYFHDETRSKNLPDKYLKIFWKYQTLY